MDRSPFSPHLLLTGASLIGPALALGLGLAPAGCKKQEEQVASSPKPAAPESRVDPRLDPRLAHGDEPGEGGGEAAAADAGMADPHGADPHAGMPMDSTHGLGGAGGGGRTPEKTADGREVLGPMTAAVPATWQDKPTTSGMRVAEWAIPGQAGDAELVVYYFGRGGAGTAQANLDRWIEQFTQPDGSSSAGKARTEKKTVAGMAVTLVQVSGRYVAAVMPGSSEKNDKPDQMLLGAIVETVNGPYYFKLVGPRATVTEIEKEFQGFIGSLTPSGK